LIDNHTNKKIDDSKKRFANRNLQWKTRQEFQRRLNQFIIEFKDNQKDDFIAQFFEKLNIDVDVSFENTSFNEFVINFNNESKSFFIFIDLLNNLNTIITIINMLVNKIFKHKIILINNITIFVVSISYIYKIFTASKYDDREFKEILIDHDASDFSSKNIEQFTTLQRISKTTFILNKKKIIFFKFDINEVFFIDTINLNIFVDVITFHIVLVQVSFLLCFVDMNRLRFYFNNLINMLIEKRSINKVLLRKELYSTHSNQTKRF
jgi:hypothetical protein